MRICRYRDMGVTQEIYTEARNPGLESRNTNTPDHPTIKPLNHITIKPFTFPLPAPIFKVIL
jgi:hypothetical protein